MNDKTTLEAQRKFLAQDQETIKQGIQQKLELLNRVSKELDQHNGALSYNQLLISRLDEALAALAAATPAQ